MGNLSQRSSEMPIPMGSRKLERDEGVAKIALKVV
jgi:hypothetical protein